MHPLCTSTQQGIAQQLSSSLRVGGKWARHLLHSRAAGRLSVAATTAERQGPANQRAVAQQQQQRQMSTTWDGGCRRRRVARSPAADLSCTLPLPAC